MANEVVRRRSPGWVRKSTQENLHGLLGALARGRASEGLSERQEWLWDAVVSELEYRRRSRAWPDCHCVWCRTEPIDKDDPN